MENDENECDLSELVLEKIKYGESLMQDLTKFNRIEGIQKLHRKIKQELNFLKKVHKSKSLKKEHLQCSNLTHFSALIQTLSEVDNCTGVNKPFGFEDRKINVDIVCDKGLSWVKVIARNPKSILQISMGNTSYGVRSVFDQAEDFLRCAELYPCLFQTPKVIFVFANGISYHLAKELETIGVIVKGDRLKDNETVDSDIPSESTDNVKDNKSDADCDIPYESEFSAKSYSYINKVNLDVSAMLAYVSSVTNGSCQKYKFSVPVLTQQAEWESKRPVKPILESYFKDKKLYCCQTAIDSFNEIVNTVGGSNERRRAEEFLKLIEVLPDNATAHDTIESNANSEIFINPQYTADKSLLVGGKIRERSLIIFTFGDRIQAVTVTANDGFVRAAKQQGINFVVFVHESRALTEQKELRAIQVENSSEVP